MDFGPIDPIIAVRRLSRTDGGSVLIRIGKPRPYPEGDNSYCPFEIVGLEYEISSRAGGVDDVQSLQLAIERIGITLNTYNQETGGNLFWFTEGDPDLGFPNQRHQ